MTIDEMLDRVAEKLGAEPKPPIAALAAKPQPKKEELPQLSTKACSSAEKSECTSHTAQSPEHKCSGGCHEKGEHKCSGHCHSGEKHACTGSCHSGGEHKCGGHCKHGADSTKLDLEYAKRLAQGLEAAAKSMGVKVVISVVNSGGNLICLHAMDDSYIASIKASQEKAFTSVALQMPTHIALEQSRGGSLDGYTNGNGILMLGGGFPLEKNGRIYGGLGISGGTKEQDILLAKIGAEVFRRL